VISYTQAIDNSSEADETFKRDVYRKRAYANLTAKRFDVALEDALSSCGGEVLDGRAHYCAGKAAYELGMYGDSKDHFEKALKTSPRDSKYRKDYICAVSTLLFHLP
jgi:tetratricopeptide (TPR) repeat protein